jgi:hypothetical protein
VTAKLNVAPKVLDAGCTVKEVYKVGGVVVVFVGYLVNLGNKRGTLSQRKQILNARVKVEVDSTGRSLDQPSILKTIADTRAMSYQT